MPEVAPAGHRTFRQDFGTGPRRALAIHCGLAASGAWRGVAEAHADRLTVTAFDLPGHGQSDDWTGGGDYLACCVRVAERLVSGRVDLIGHSFGAVTALALALARPERFRTLTLIEPVLFAAARGTPEWGAHLERMAEFDRAMGAGKGEAAARAFTAVWGTGVDWGRMTAGARSDLAARIHLIGATGSALFDDSAGLLGPGRLEALRIPVLLIRGAESPPIIAPVASALAARLPDARIATVAGAGHMVPITHPAETARLVAVNLGRG